jgi:hypothetical protein
MELTLKLKCDKPLSKFAFNSNLRRYTQDQSEGLLKKVAAELVDGRGLHSSNPQPNLSRFWHNIHPLTPLNTPRAPWHLQKPPKQPLNATPISQTGLMLS